MVIQRSPARPRVWGYADTVGDSVTVQFGAIETVRATAVAGPDGRPVWEVLFNPISAPGPHTITVTQQANGCVAVLDDVLVGDVWICSGQSNMQHSVEQLDNPQPDLDDAVNYPNVRTFFNDFVYSDVPLNDLQSVVRSWQLPTAANIAGFSAVCWLYGRNLYRKLQRPIGLIETNWGGTRIEAWSSPDALKVCFGEAGPPVNSPPNGASQLWNAMINPFLPMPIYGAIWYQGESNTYNSDKYACALNAMVTDWRTKWYARSPTMGPVFPFGEVQLAPWQNADIVTGFPDIRWAQTDGVGYTPNNNFLRIFMAVAMDLPDYDSPYGNIHPRYKRQIADRLALAGFNVAYGLTDGGIFKGPIPTLFNVSSADGKVRVHYDIPIVYRAITGFELCCSSHANDLVCNEAGGQAVWSKATPSSFAPTYLDLSVPCSAPNQYVVGFRYAWRESPCEFEACAVYSVENSLPAPPYMAHWAATRTAGVATTSDGSAHVTVA
jgi:sialate O-acetylesterase